MMVITIVSTGISCLKTGPDPAVKPQLRTGFKSFTYEIEFHAKLHYTGSYPGSERSSYLTPRTCRPSTFLILMSSPTVKTW